MMHPHQLHALAALWSLRQSWPRLVAQAVAVDADLTAHRLLAASDGLQAWRPVIGRSGGGHGDPVSGLAVACALPPRQINLWRQLAARTDATIRWLAGRIGGDTARTHTDPLAYLTQLVPGMRPATAAHLTAWVRDEDERLRATLGMPADAWPLPGEECRACGVRMLRLLASSPDRSDWMIACTADCVCAGDGCLCGMDVTAAGVRHIWRADCGPKTSAVMSDSGTS